ncbi:MAG: hypothetical protein ABI836_05635 [Gemmatimonadota bacterium]
MLTFLCLFQLSAGFPPAPPPGDSAGPPSTIAIEPGTHFDSFIPQLPAAQPPGDPGLAVPPTAVDTPRTVAIEYGDGYYTRLTIHKYASYATLPLFALQYWSGQQLIKNNNQGAARSIHGPVAAGIYVLFGVNTVTGIWNLYASRKDPNGRARRTVHSLLMLLTDAGFVWTGALAPGHEEGSSSARADKHRTVAITSGSIALAGYLMMLVWKE